MNREMQAYMKKAILLISLLSLILIVSCQSEPSVRYSYQSPENINDGFIVGNLDEVSINSELIVKAVNDINQGKYKEVHSILIFKDDKLVLDEYFDGHKYEWDAPKHHGDLVTWNNTMSHHIKSDTKSIISILIGIALDQGFIESVHQSIFDYLPEHQHLNTEGKDKITIEHLLTMTSGLKWNEWGAPLSSSDNDIVGLWFPPCEDPITCVLERPLINEPGTSFTYNGGGTIVLGEIIKNATKMNIDKFSRKYLFEPLEIDSFNWWNRFENGVFEASGGLEITPRDMVKIGVTFLNNGVWAGKQIISQQWVEKSAVSYHDNKGINIPGTDQGNNGYSYSWWINSFSNSGKRINMFYAGGWGGQNIMVFPELNTVVVFTGGNYTSKTTIFKILEKYVIPAFD
jgi:CubicO group peptidase (beta-lactamase class C family)